MGHKAPKAWIAIGPRRHGRLTAAQLVRKWGSLPKTERDRAMWTAGHAAGEIAGQKAEREAFRDRVIEVLGIRPVVAPDKE